MADDAADRPFGDAWVQFVGAAARDLGRLPTRRPVDQFIQLREAVLAEAKRPEIAGAIQRELSGLYAGAQTPPPLGSGPENGRRIAELLLMEMRAYAAAVDVADQMHSGAGTADPPGPPRLTRLGKTFLDSLRDIADKLPPHVKALLKLFSEVFEIFD